MTERMRDQSPINAPTSSEGVWVDLGLIVDEEAYRQAFSEHLYGLSSVGTSAPADTDTDTNLRAHSGEISHSGLSEKAKRVIRNGLAIVAVSSIFVGGIGAVYALNPGNIQQVVKGFSDKAVLNFASGSSDAPVQNGIIMNPMLTNSPESLSPNNCATYPESEIGVMTVSGKFPIDAIVLDKNHSTPFAANPYMQRLHNVAFEAKKFPEMVYYKLPLGFTICDLGGGIIKSGDKYTIDHSKLMILFQDPSSKSMVNTAINIQPQLKTDKTSILDPSKHEWASYPVNGLFLDDGTDPTTGKIVDQALNASVTGVVKTMKDPQVIRELMSIFETQAVQQVATSNITKRLKVPYPDNLTSLYQFADKALLQRLGTTIHNVTFKELPDKPPLDYVIKMATPTNPTTKKSITENPISNIDLTQVASVKVDSIVYGYPTLAASPTALPTPQIPSPTQIAKNAP